MNTAELCHYKAQNHKKRTKMALLACSQWLVTWIDSWKFQHTSPNPLWDPSLSMGPQNSSSSWSWLCFGRGGWKKVQGKKNNIRTCCRNKWVMRCMLVEWLPEGLQVIFSPVTESCSHKVQGGGSEGIKTCHLSLGCLLRGWATQAG